MRIFHRTSVVISDKGAIKIILAAQAPVLRPLQIVYQEKRIQLINQNQIRKESFKSGNNSRLGSGFQAQFMKKF